MICSFTQTYSNNRQELFYYHNKDTSDIYFRNKMDKNYYAFHNSPEEYISDTCDQEYFKQINKVQVLRYNDMSYTETLFKTLQKCKEDGVKYLCFLQDDVYCLQNTHILDSLIEFIRNNTFDMLNIEIANCNLRANRILYQKDHIIIYDTTSDDFKDRGYWAYDDGPFIANVDFLMNKIYDEGYLNQSDVWKGEHYLNHKISENKIQRLTCHVTVFRRFNIVGPNSNLIRAN